MAKKKRNPAAVPAEPPPQKASAAPDRPGGDAPATAGEDKKKRPAWRSGFDFILMLGVAVTVALLIKAYVFSIYLIPSGSMETALHGRPDGGDRIFCSKLSYRFRPLERWEVAVFEFPFELARRNSREAEISSEYDGQNFVKRIVGMPGESMAIGRGDIWVRPEGARTEYKRMVKPDSVQRGMWLKVYAEDFSDLSLPELERFWNMRGGAAVLGRGGPLLLRAGAEPALMDYRPMVPAGPGRGRMAEMPGIPDRYVLRQPVQFRCRNLLESGGECGHVFVGMAETHNIQGRCPSCSRLVDETEVVFYHRRSGLLGYGGPYAVPPADAPQGELARPREDGYHIVPDLRMNVRFTLERPETSLAVTFREDSRFVEIAVDGSGNVELRVNGRPALARHRRAAGIRPGRDHALECYIVEGQVRVFLDGAEAPVLDEAVWDDKRPFPRNAPKTSGVGLTALGGDVGIAGLSIDRDVFYFSGWEENRGGEFPAMSSQGEVRIPADSFLPMGDHCPSSFDARSWGPVPLSLLRGPALYIWWPPERIGRIPSP